MARTELDAALVELDASHVSAGIALSEEAGWNQMADDWALMIRLGDASGIGAGGQLVATALALPYPPRFGWISMVLVHGPYRRRGLATRLLQRSIAALQARGLVPLLDATPAGLAVYEQLGFRPVETLTRWRGHGGRRVRTAFPPIAPAELGGLRELDGTAFGADRLEVLADLLGRKHVVARRDPGGGGHLLSRVGRTATHIGPVVARDAEIGVSLVEDALAAIPGPALIDVPDRETALAELLHTRGFERERPYVRMALGRVTAFGDATLVRAIAGPELG